MKRRSLPPRRAYSALRTLSSASPRWRMMWNFVEQDRGLRRLFPRDVAERFPHVHHDEPDFAALPWPQPSVELRHARLGTVFAAEPDRPLAHQIADHDAIDVALANRDLVDADRPGSRRARPFDLRPHVLHLECLDCFPIELQLLGCQIASNRDPLSRPILTPWRPETSGPGHRDNQDENAPPVSLRSEGVARTKERHRRRGENFPPARRRTCRRRD